VVVHEQDAGRGRCLLCEWLDQLCGLPTCPG
jgi:hypothetical protein